MEQKEQFIPFLFDEPVYLIQGIHAVKKAVSPSSQSSAHHPEPTVTKKHLIVLCNEATHEDLAFLNKILDAVKLAPEDYHVGIKSPNPAFVADKLLYFGMHAQSGVHSMYELFKKDNQKILSADPLNILQHDVSRKKLLWAALQKMFA